MQHQCQHWRRKFWISHWFYETFQNCLSLHTQIFFLYADLFKPTSLECFSNKNISESKLMISGISRNFALNNFLNFRSAKFQIHSYWQQKLCKNSLRIYNFVSFIICLIYLCSSRSLQNISQLKEISIIE